MLTWQTTCKSFVAARNEDEKEFTYMEFADHFNDNNRTTIDLYYIKVLDIIISNKSSLSYYASTQKKEFTKRNNPRSNFGQSYISYWKDRQSTTQDLRMHKRALDVEEAVQEHIVKRVLRSFDGNSTRQEEQESSSSQEEKEDEGKCVIRKIKSVLEDSKDVPTCCLSNLKILDISNKHILRIMKERLTEDKYLFVKKKMTIPDWKSDEHAMKLLDLIKNCKTSYRYLRQLVRTSVIPVEEFDANVHYNLLTVETILNNFLNLLEYNGPLVTKEFYERTCASSMAIPILNALFMKYSSKLSSKWFEIESKYTNRHKFDGVVFCGGLSEPIMLGEFGGATCGVEKIEEDTIKVYRNGQRIINEMATKTKSGKTPTLFITLFHKASLKFDSLRLISDCTYVRNTYAKLKAPTSPDELKSIFNEMRNVFAWRDAMVESIGYIYEESSDGSSPNCTYDTSSVCSTP